MIDKVEMQLSQKELNELYYVLGSALRHHKEKGENSDFVFMGVSVSENLLTRIGDEIYKLAKKQEAFEEQLAQDKLNHDLNFKRKFAKYGDY